jgi:restriction endonuclease Mrr
MLSEHDVAGLIAGEKEAYDHVVALARQFTLRQRGLRSLSREDARDTVQEALLAAIQSTQSGTATTAEELSNIIRRAVITQSQEFHRRNTNESYTLGDGPYATFRGHVSFHPNDLKEPLKVLYRPLKRPEQDARARIDLLAVDAELIRYLSNHPQMLYELKPRRFEELIAEILRGQGYSVELTANSADGGIDIFATQKTGVGEALLIVDCKRYAAKKPVGVEIVRSLFGIGEQVRATMAMLATTSYFTAPAKEFQQTVRHRVSLKAFTDLQDWLRDYQPN